VLAQRDAQILSELRKDARKKLTDISRTTGIPTSTVHERLRAYKKEGLRLVTLLDYPQMRMPLQCWLLIKTRNKYAVLEYLESSLFVNAILVVNNGVDFAVECVFSTLKQQHNTLEELGRFGKVIVYPVIEELGRELACPIALSQKT
jgi:DNA-binding Lrp family transcriptional regulator